MSHHDHDHKHHHHHHDHHHEQKNGHTHDPGMEKPAGGLSELEKLVKMVEHWINHCGEHAQSYMEWAERAKAIGQEEVYTILEKVAIATRQQNESLSEALALLKSNSSSS